MAPIAPAAPARHRFNPLNPMPAKNSNNTGDRGDTQQPYTAFMPRIRKSPFFDATRRWGCNAYSVYNHTFMPLYYVDPEADYRRLIEDVSLWDVAGQRQVEITGPDAARFTQYLTPRNLSGMERGQCKYVLITDDNGGIINDPVLLKLNDNHFWLSLADADVLLWARGAALHSGMEINIGEPDVSPLQVQGPKSSGVMAALFGDWINKLRYYRFRETELDGIPVVVSRTGWSSERGYEVFLRDSRHAGRLWETIMEAGKPFRIAPGAPSMIRRIEGGMCSHGADTGLDTNPFEIGLGRLVDLEQESDFIGKQALRRIREQGVRRRLAGVEIHAAPLAANEHPWTVRRDGAVAGKLSSMVYSPRLEKNIGLALLATAHTAIGSKLHVDADTGTGHAQYDATVVPLPFYDPGKKLASG